MEFTWNTLLRWNTGYSADTVEWCPVEGYEDYLACGTYQLDKKDEGQETKQKRLGRIYLFIIDENAEQLSPIQTIETAGILDQKWCHNTLQDYPVLGVVTSEGYIQLYRLDKIEEGCKLKLWIESSIGEGILALSIDWSSNKTAAMEPRLVISDSAGKVHILEVAGDSLNVLSVWKAHGFEAWVTAFNYWNTDIFYSGGDDCLFKCYDVRMPDAVITNKTHEAGVTAIRSDVAVEHRLLTGSYDEKIRLWDARQLKRCIAEADVGGGVWRLKWHPYKINTVLAACMYGGFRIVSVEDQPSVACEYLEHNSIAYGADWKSEPSASIVATCSFYDCKLHISEITMN